MTTTEALERLERLRKLRTRQARALERTETELLTQAIPEAAAAGVPKRTIARIAGVARQTVYNVLGRDA
jgi:DNA invertase Pin-like site-specific DNA recombinase